MTHRYDEIRDFPTIVDDIHQSCYRSHQILEAVKDMLKDYYSSEAILDLIGLLEQDLPNGKPNKVESVSRQRERIMNTAIATNTAKDMD